MPKVLLKRTRMNKIVGWKEGREYINSAWGGWLGKGSDEKSECPRE